MSWLISGVMSMYDTFYVHARTVVRTVYDNSEVSGVGVGMHQGSNQSPLLLAIVKEAISMEFQGGLP